ncbi:MAG: phosphoribosylaminoimidazolesuccinocarboxamide synthase [Cyanobacteria bacterium P01_A01_bin.135]
MAVAELYEGKAKILYTTDDPDVLLSQFKDDATAFNAQKRGTIAKKGAMNCAISTHLFKLLESQGIPTHWIDSPSPTEMRVRRVTIIPLEVVVRNLAAGSLVRETGLPTGQPLEPPLVEFYYKDDALGDPLLTRARIAALGIASEAQVTQLDTTARRINEILTDFFQRCRIALVDFKLEFGHDPQGRLLLADEISPDTCRLWDQAIADPNARVMDKDRFRHDLGQVEAAYSAVMERVLAQPV